MVIFYWIVFTVIPYLVVWQVNKNKTRIYKQNLHIKHHNFGIIYFVNGRALDKSNFVNYKFVYWNLRFKPKYRQLEVTCFHAGQLLQVGNPFCIMENLVIAKRHWLILDTNFYRSAKRFRKYHSDKGTRILDFKKFYETTLLYLHYTYGYKNCLCSYINYFPRRVVQNTETEILSGFKCILYHLELFL